MIKFILIWITCIAISLYTFKELKHTINVGQVIILVTLAPATAIVGTILFIGDNLNKCVLGCK